MTDSAADWPQAAVEALRTAVADLGGSLGPLLVEAVRHLETLVLTGPGETVAAVAVPAAVFGRLTDRAAPAGLLACAAATYLALDVLDDRMDGEEPAFWADRSANEIMMGAQVLLLTANQSLSLAASGVAEGAATELTSLFRAMIAEVTEGQLQTEQPLTETTTPASVGAAISARSGAMLAGFAGLAAVLAGAAPAEVEAARAFGRELAVARQHVNDLTELLGDQTADLRNRTPTMAAALALQALPAADRPALITSMQTAVADRDARRRLVAALTPAIAEVCVLVQLHLSQARRVTRTLPRRGVGPDGLDQLIEHTATTLRSPHVHRPSAPGVLRPGTRALPERSRVPG
ncbi:MAG TPA: polyprenyl synthetase family protein [Propionibacteriaceae bacterium]